MMNFLRAEHGPCFTVSVKEIPILEAFDVAADRVE